MSNRDALRKLSRKYPATPEIDKIMDDLRAGKDDLHIAIIATAIAEAALERLITKKLQVRTKNLLGQLFLNRGPLSDFHSKILVANAFGVITTNMAEELHSLKAIRNTFAHAKVPISFDHDLISIEVRSLRMLKAIRNAETEAGRLELTNKSWFLLISKILLVMMDEIEKHPGWASQVISEALGSDKPPSKPT